MVAGRTHPEGLSAPSTAVTFRQFLTISACPPQWRGYDLYLLRDGDLVFYVGQSYCAFERVWEHIRGGVKGHAILGRFLLVNWPRSGGFMVELLSSRAPQFAAQRHDLDAAERSLIERYAPCFNVSLNQQPAPLPAGYLPPNAPVKYLRSYKRMLREAGYAARKAENNQEWD